MQRTVKMVFRLNNYVNAKEWIMHTITEAMEEDENVMSEEFVVKEGLLHMKLVVDSYYTPDWIYPQLRDYLHRGEAILKVEYI